jgi:DNA-binding NarL/FixJ family response regulator
MAEYELKDISVAVVSRDPYFLFAVKALLGRDRRARIFTTAPSLKALQDEVNGLAHPLNAVVFDADSLAGESNFFLDLRYLAEAMPGAKILCLAQGNLKQVAARIENSPLSALLAKRDLGYCLHLAIRAVVDEDVTLVTAGIRALLTPGSTLDRESRTIGPETAHPDLTPRIAEIVIWRIFIGLDNPDIQDELLLGRDTIREYVSKAYKALGASSELEAFDALSDWWWTTRFAHALR